MAHRSAALFALRRSVPRGRRASRLAPFELAAVQGVELGVELLVFQFQALTLPALLSQHFMQFCQLVFVVALRAELAL
jgi:hypothetical protein